MVKDRSTIIFYATAVCNLKCTYCFIDKNPALVEIDNMLDESFKGDYYLEFAKKVFPDPEQLKEIQIWGGEPTLNFHRIAPTIKAILDYYPNIHQIMFSTNLAHDKTLDEIYYLLRYIKDCQDIELHLQLSLDGPTYITDANRGIGTTEKFSKNFAKLVCTVDELLDECKNITIMSFNKSTLDLSSIRALQTKEKLINYYKFLEAFADTAQVSKNPRFIFNPSVPNTACPLPITIEDGKLFANLCKLSREIEKENKLNQIFKYYTCITPFDRGNKCNPVRFCNKGACGSGKYCLGLLPNNLISTCHSGFTDLLESYKEQAINNTNRNTSLQQTFFKSLKQKEMVFDYEWLAQYEKQVEELYLENAYNQFAAVVGEIQFLAANSQVDAQYKNPKKAAEGAQFIFDHTSYCMRDNLNTSGTKIIIAPNLMKLLLNGAKEYIEDNDR